MRISSSYIHKYTRMYIENDYWCFLGCVQVQVQLRVYAFGFHYILLYSIFFFDLGFFDWLYEFVSQYTHNKGVHTSLYISSESVQLSVLSQKVVYWVIIVCCCNKVQTRSSEWKAKKQEQEQKQEQKQKQKQKQKTVWISCPPRASYGITCFRRW